MPSTSPTLTGFAPAVAAGTLPFAGGGVAGFWAHAKDDASASKTAARILMGYRWRAAGAAGWGLCQATKTAVAVVKVSGQRDGGNRRRGAGLILGFGRPGP